MRNFKPEHYNTVSPYLIVSDAAGTIKFLEEVSVDTSWQAMQPHSNRSTYVNYLSHDDDGAVQAAYQSNMQRLVGLKRRYDPSNVFHLNRNIRP